MKNFEQVCRLVRQGLDDGAYPSACLSVGIRGSVCVRQTFGPARETTLYDIASLSKIVGTTMIAFRFLEEGRLRLYDTVEQFFPAPEDKKGITVLQLMTHTSGLPPIFISARKRTAPETPSGRSLPTRWSMRQALCPFTAAWDTSFWGVFWNKSAASPSTGWHRSMYSSLWA